MKPEQQTRYEDRIARVCAYIEQNLDEDFTLYSLSRVAAFSKYHFHRVFSAITGLSPAGFIQRSRLKRASFQLAFHDDERIIDIALKAGFESPEAFSRAFKLLDFAGGDIISLTMTAEVIWKNDEPALCENHDRVIRLSLTSGYVIRNALPHRWELMGNGV